jgi:hypothetical protein
MDGVGIFHHLNCFFSPYTNPDSLSCYHSTATSHSFKRVFGKKKKYLYTRTTGNSIIFAPACFSLMAHSSIPHTHTHAGFFFVFNDLLLLYGRMPFTLRIFASLLGWRCYRYRLESPAALSLGASITGKTVGRGAAGAAAAATHTHTDTHIHGRLYCTLQWLSTRQKRSPPRRVPPTRIFLLSPLCFGIQSCAGCRQRRVRVLTLVALPPLHPHFYFTISLSLHLRVGSHFFLCIQRHLSWGNWRAFSILPFVLIER